MSHHHGLPQTGDAQEIGQDAAECLLVNKPRSWLLRNLDGTDDYGLDYQVQLKVQQQVVHIFRLQLKGTRSPKISANGDFISIALSASTLRYYDNIEEPVLLVLCDLSVNLAEPRSCPMYFVWMPEELRRIDIENIELSQEEVTVRVPTANVLTRETELLDDVRKYHELARVGHALDVRLASMKPELEADQRLALVQGIEKSIAARSVAFTEALAEPPRDFWLNPPPHGSLAWHLTEVRTSINTGKLRRCQDALKRASAELAGGTPLERAEYWHLTGRLRTASGDEEAAVRAFKEAAEADPQPKYCAAWAESELRRRFRLDGSQHYSDIASALPTANDPLILSVKARLLAADRRYEEAIILLDTFSGPDNLAAKAEVQTMFSKHQEALQACIDGLAAPGARESTRHLFLILRARARFNLALKSARAYEPPSEADEILPPSGPRGIDAQLLRVAWEDIQEAVQAMEGIGWASNAEFLVDMWAATASMLGRQKEILPSLIAAARKRPHVQELQSAVESIAAQCGDFGAAIEANGRLADSDLKILRRAAILHEAGKHRDCVELIESWIGSVDRTHQLFGDVLVLATQSANVIVRSDLVEAWSSLLNQTPDLAPYGAVLAYFLARARNKLEGDEPLLELERRDAELDHPLPTTVALFQELDPGMRSQAEKFLVVAGRLRSRTRLSSTVALQVGVALSTLERWPALLALCDEAEREFDSSPRMRAFKALALDRLGKTEDARLILEEMLEGGISDALALNTYVNIMVRWGYVAQAIVATEKILEETDWKSRKVECIRLLFNLVQTADPLSQRLVDLAFRMGELADPENEVEEGVFLSMVLIATSFGQSPLTQQRQSELNSRANQFFESFPNSKVLRRMETVQEASGDDILRAIKQAIGLTEERENSLAKIEAQMQRGELTLPFAWRPKNALSTVQDVVHLWELAKHSSADDKKYHLNMVGAEWTPIPAADLRKSIPLLDLTTLLVLNDLELLDELFAFFPEVAISQQTLGELLQLTQAFSGSLWRDKCLDVQQRLKRHLGQILQPHATTTDEEPRLSLASREIEKLVQSGGYLLYSDDVLFRIWCLRSEGKPGGMCTLDLLCALDEIGRLSIRDVSMKLAKLCSWHVGIHILLRHQLAIVPEAVLRARDVDAGVGLLQSSPDFMAIATGIWDFRSDFLKGLQHVGAVIRELINLKDIPTVAISSFVGVWYVKAKLRHDKAVAPLDILCNVALYAAAPNPALDDGSARRLWSVYIELVAFEHNKLMDEQRDREARRTLARRAAVLDARTAADGIQVQTTLRDKLMCGLTAGTEAADVFAEAYSSERIVIAVKDKQGAR